MKLILLLVVVTVCLAQEPKPCESPKRWEGKRSLIDEMRPVKVLSTIYYDAEDKRVRDVEEVEQGTEKDFYDVLRLYNTSKEYRLNMRTKKCNITDLKEPFRPIAIPMDAKFMFVAEVGPSQIPLEHFTSYTFYGNFTETPGVVEYVMTHTYPSCVPIAHTYQHRPSAVAASPIESRYYDIKVGKYNATNFDIPPECMQTIY